MTTTPADLTAARMFLATHAKRTGWTLQHPLAALLAGARAAERERCAKVVLDEVDGADEERARDSMLSRIAAAIRAGSET